MGYVICKFQNTTGYNGNDPSIIIEDTHPEWEQIMKRWKEGKNPTDSKLWKKCVIALTKPKEEGV